MNMPTAPDASLPAIQFEHVSIRYRVPREPLSGLKETVIHLMKQGIEFRDFWALQDVSFTVQPGESFGIIGRNGAGKSTLLKVLARVLRPIAGRVVTRGRVAPLLELGGGFHSELTGRENVYMNGALLGLSREQIREVYPWIVEFSELAGFMEAPIRTYSTGMVSRLGFAVATCSRPDVLLVDEALSVGDVSYQQKCFSRMADFHRQGTTIILVSHSVSTIESFCDNVLWLDSGRVYQIGTVNEVAEAYNKFTRRGLMQAEGQGSGIYTDVDVMHPYYAYIQAASAANKIVGYADNSFRPDQPVNRAQLCVTLMKVIPRERIVPPAAEEQVYQDVPVSYPMANWINEAYRFGMVFNEAGKRMWPDQAVTRGQAARWMCTALRVMPKKPSEMFKDVPAGDPLAKYYEEVVRRGWLEAGGDDKDRFRPEEPITRAEMARAMCGMLQLPVEKSRQGK
jgi:ABC-type polysaccharide/polyol phosphate transport system ATPase subunit